MCFVLQVSKINSGKKKTPIMLLNWQPCLGKGVSRQKKGPFADECQRLNLMGHPEDSRFLAFAALKAGFGGESCGGCSKICQG